MKNSYLKKNWFAVAFCMCCCFFVFDTKAQQQTLQSFYFFNPLVFNPAYAGSQGALTVTGNIRDQWTSFKGAPKTECLSIHSPLKNENIGLGAVLINDELGATKTTSAYGDFAYSIRLNKKNHRLVFGLQGGIDCYRTNFSNLTIIDNTDNVYLNGFNYSKTLFNVGAGIYYYGERFYLGASCPGFLNNKLNISAGQTAVQENHYYVFGGVVLKLNSVVNMRPSFMIKYVQNAPLSVDANLSFLFYDKIWLGAMYRYNSFVGANIMFNVRPNFRIGYAYDYSISIASSIAGGSHEIMLSYSFKTMSKGFKTPRYF
jgi:type IX secretion system PorP/SprF family membrane protein